MTESLLPSQPEFMLNQTNEIREKVLFKSNWTRVLLLFVLPALLIVFWNDHQRTFADLLLFFGVSIFLLVWLVTDKHLTFIEIDENLFLKNQLGLRNKIFKVSDIVYVGRVYFNRGVCIFFFFKDAQNLIDHSHTAEMDYSDETLISLFASIKKVKGELKMDEAYENMLKENYLERGLWGGVDSYEGVKIKLNSLGFRLKYSFPWKEFFIG